MSNSSRSSLTTADSPGDPRRGALLDRDSERLLTPAFLLVLCLQFCFGLSYSTFFLLPKFLAREFHAHADAIGAVAATALLASVVAAPVFLATGVLVWSAIAFVPKKALGLSA